jgi:tetratricopeptide (TPR) repeat protein
VSRQSVIFAISGTFFGLLAGWIIGAQRAAVTSAPAQTAAASAPAPQGQNAPAGLDTARVTQLTAQASAEPTNATVRAALGNAYFDADRFTDAITWYRESLKIKPDDPDVSTDLGIAFYYTNDPDRALAQFAHSLKINPAHTKTLLNQGIVLAFAKQDLDGAAKAWQGVVKLAPDSPEGQAAKRALEGLRAAHPGSGPS